VIYSNIHLSVSISKLMFFFFFYQNFKSYFGQIMADKLTYRFYGKQAKKTSKLRYADNNNIVTTTSVLVPVYMVFNQPWDIVLI